MIFANGACDGLAGGGGEQVGVEQSEVSAADGRPLREGFRACVCAAELAGSAVAGRGPHFSAGTVSAHDPHSPTQDMHLLCLLPPLQHITLTSPQPQYYYHYQSRFTNYKCPTPTPLLSPPQKTSEVFSEPHFIGLKTSLGPCFFFFRNAFH